MGGTTSTSVSTVLRGPQRAATVTALKENTLRQLASAAAPPRTLTQDSWSTHVPAGGNVAAFLTGQARQYAERGGAPLLKAEVVHLIMTIRNMTHAVPITMAAYTALMHRGADELYATLRALMYSPEFLAPTLAAAATSTRTGTVPCDADDVEISL